MKIDELKAFAYHIPLAAPLWAGPRKIAEREGYLIKLESAAGSFIGDIAPLPGMSPENLARAAEELKTLNDFARSGKLSGAFSDILRQIDELSGARTISSSVRFGFESALCDFARCVGAESLSLPAVKEGTLLSVNGFLSTDMPDVFELFEGYLRGGYRTIKIKMGRRGLDDDINFVRDIIAGSGDEIRLRIDVNRLWSFKEAASFAESVNLGRIEYIEEPLSEIGRLAELAAQTGISIAIDETLNYDGAGSLPPRFPGLVAAIVKPTLAGGVIAACRLAEKLTALEVVPVVSSSFETGVGLRTLALLAGAIHPAGVAAGLDTHRFLAETIFPIGDAFEGGNINLEKIRDAVNAECLEHLEEVILC